MTRSIDDVTRQAFKEIFFEEVFRIGAVPNAMTSNDITRVSLKLSQRLLNNDLQQRITTKK